MAGYSSVGDEDDASVARLELRAARHDRSAGAEVRTIREQGPEGGTDTEFDRYAAELRALTANRRHTPAEVLQGEGRNER